MRIDAVLAQGTTRSFEFFPPKSDEESAVLATTLGHLEPLRPSFVSVTYRGGPSSRQRTFDLVTQIQRRGQIMAMAHLICVGHSRDEMRTILANYAAAGVENVMALGGDVPDDPAERDTDFTHAIDLVEMIRETGDFAVGVAAHPQGHPRSPDRSSDRRFLARKLHLADFAITQFFFELDEWTRLADELGALGVSKPVIPGIMPVTTLHGISRMAEMGARVPPALIERLERANQRGGPSAVRAEGIDAARELCAALLDSGAPGLHFYTLNRSTATREIYSALFGGTPDVTKDL